MGWFFIDIENFAVFPIVNFQLPSLILYMFNLDNNLLNKKNSVLKTINPIEGMFYMRRINIYLYVAKKEEPNNI